MARKLIVEIVGDSRSYERALGRSSRATETFGTSVKNGARNLARVGVAAGVVATGLGVASVKSFASFQETMEQIIGLAGGAQKDVHKFTDEILRLGPEVGKGPQELADALYFVASAGIAVSDQMDVVTRAAKASAAGLGETQTVADAVTSAMNAYGASVVDAARATDVLVNTVRFGKGEADSFAPVLGTTAAIAAQLGVRFEEVGAALAAQTRLGVSAETSAVQLQAVFSALLKSTPKAEKAFKSVGLSTAGLREELKQKGLLATLFTLKDAFGENTAAMAGAFSNVRALRGVLALVGKSAKGTKEVFDGMTDSTGALDIAFGAISKGTAFRFKQAMAALAGIGIQVGAAIAPLANIVATGLNKALGVINDFIGDLSHARTIRAKLDVIWQGAVAAGERATNLLKKAVDSIDWRAVWTGATGLADELQKKLEEVDWGFIGEQIGMNIKKAAGAVFPAAQEIADRIFTAFRTIDWETLGRAMGPGLATAVVSGFATLLDPSFWIRNWDLALSIGLAAFSGPIGKIGGKLAPLIARPFARLGETAILAIASGIERLSPRLASIFLRAVTGIPALIANVFGRVAPLVARALEPLTGFVRRQFARLGRIARFTIKVLGIDLAVRAVVNFGQRVYRYLRNLTTKTIPGLFRSLWTSLEKRAIQAALKIIEPFTHLPKRLGGGTFQKLKEEWKATLLAMESDADTSTKNIQASIDNNIHDREVIISVVGAETGGHPPPARNTPPRRTTTRTTQTTTGGGGGDGGGDGSGETTKQRNARLRKQAEKAKTAFENTIDGLELQFDQAVARKQFKAAENVLKQIRDTIIKRIGVVGRTTELARQLWENSQTMKQTVTDANQATADAVKAAQFKAIGLTATGEQRLPSGRSLLRRATGMLDWIKGTALDTDKNRAQLRKIVAFLKQNYETAGREVRQAIIDMLNKIKGAGSDTTTTAKGPLTKTAGLNTKAIIAGAGLDADQARLIRSRLSKFNTAGLRLAGSGTRSTSGQFVDDRPIIIHTTVNLDGSKVATNTTKHQQKQRRRNPKQKRGPNTNPHGI